MSAASFPPPTGAPVSRTAPARPAASGSNAPAQGGQGGQPAQPAPKTKQVGRKFLWGSASLLRFLRLVAVLACLVAGGVGAYVLSTTSTSLGSISTGTQQVLRLQQIKGDILRADGIATFGLAQGASATSADYTSALQEASQLVVQASDAQAADQADLTSVNGGLLNYALAMERARTAYPSNNATGLKHASDASTLLTNETVPALDKLIASNTARVDAARAAERLWAVGLALIPVLLLLGISIWLARRTRRVLNLGLVIALATSVLLWRLVDINLANSAAAVDSARSGSLQAASAAGMAYTKLAESKSIEGRELLQPAQVASLDTAWTSAVTAAQSEVTKLSGGAAVKANIDSYTKAHTAAMTLLKANKVTEGRAAAANQTTGTGVGYTAAIQALTTASDEARTTTQNDVAEQQKNLQLGTWLALLLGLLGALAAWIGIGQRLREYR